MFQKNYLAVVIASVCSVATVSAESEVILPEIKVVVSSDDIQVDSMKVTKTEIERKQPRDLKALFADQLDVQVNDLQGSRSGNAGINIRGLEGNRVGMTIDGVPLPEAQDNKLFVTFGQDVGSGNTIEPMALRSATVTYSGSNNSLSGSVGFATLEPSDLIKNGNVGGFVATGYDSVDNSVYGSVGGAAKNDRYEGLVVATGRFGHETENKGTVGGEGPARTKADPADYKNNYVLVKNAYQVNDENKLKLTFEHQQKIKDSDVLSSAVLNSRTGPVPAMFNTDESRRARVSLEHEYISDTGIVQEANTHIYYQNANTLGYRNKPTKRTENSAVKDQSIGVSSDLVSKIDTAIPQSLHYGFSYQYSRLKNDINCPECSHPPYSTFIIDPSADIKQHKTHLYLEDEITLGDVVITPHVGVLNYRSNPSKSGHQQAASELIEVKNQNHTVFLPKFAINWKVLDAFEPYFQYSRGVKTPSSQELTSSFGHSGSYFLPNGQAGQYKYALVGNPNLRPELADNFSLGIKGRNDAVQYNVSGYYNKYRNFITTVNENTAGYSPLMQYANLEKAKIYGVTADAKVRVYGDFFVSGGVAYSKGTSQNSGEKAPINTIQPLKLKAGLGYEGETFGADIRLTHVSVKKDKDINIPAQETNPHSSAFYNPTRTVNLVDLGVYWKPVTNLMFTANLNNVFNKKYWNWADVSRFAVQKSSGGAGDTSMILNKDNADRYSAPGRNFNVGLRYEF
ncbi:TonB-dependent receptor [Vespertiliibacter pulmonis]|uniref:Hemoglobin/transferrin/lactoferrin receptor protein n=1 Tax=Vespertiliibacter pulmonis TaxID=1443036 RepID=A0A3N4VXM6_9PAST|nr:TonB-dependent hemoglobin/transferrin/lactoferrin family receptor [Vespertiliibacter pulmonis]QLB20151.1 TonB-dependent receptor [Vespertiliibacter pulmonis]RPE86123.1 hemoglobin/transferrin/lactoferrin receptor protein [Vespertiliibacter pulmonis]